MKTIQMEIDEALLAEVERAIEARGTTRSKFICHALRLVLIDSHVRALEKAHRSHVRALEKAHREGYKKYPVAEGEFDVWETERVWGDR